jgi:probable phosphoglycerate mutase
MVADEDAPQPQLESGGAAAREARVRGEARPHVILLRHGEPDWSPGGGPSVNDPGLTPLGRAQAEAAAAHLAGQRIDALYASPYRRSQETAQPLARATGLPIVTVAGLAEIGVAVSGLSQEDVDRYFVAGSRRPLHEHWDGWPGAETFHEFHERVTGALVDVLGRHGMKPKREHDFTIWSHDEPPANVAIVAHGGTNAVALTQLLDLDPVPWEWLRFESELAAYSVLQARDLGPNGLVWSLQAFGLVDHLIEAGIRPR